MQVHHNYPTMASEKQQSVNGLEEDAEDDTTIEVSDSEERDILERLFHEEE